MFGNINSENDCSSVALGEMLMSKKLKGMNKLIYYKNVLLLMYFTVGFTFSECLCTANRCSCAGHLWKNTMLLKMKHIPSQLMPISSHDTDPGLCFICRAAHSGCSHVPMVIHISSLHVLLKCLILFKYSFTCASSFCGS